MKHCTLCNRYIEPQKKFNWALCILFLGVFYLPYYFFFAPKKYCPICKTPKLNKLSPEDEAAKTANRKEKIETVKQTFADIKNNLSQ